MPSSPLLSCVRFVPASPTLGCPGLLGWVSFRSADGLLIDGVGLRRSLRGAYVFSYPVKRSGSGRFHHLVRPADDATRQALEAELLAALFVEIREVGA
jgi:hypothetical protein